MIIDITITDKLPILEISCAALVFLVTTLGGTLVNPIGGMYVWWSRSTFLHFN